MPHECTPRLQTSRAWWVDLQWFHKLGKGPGQIAGRASLKKEAGNAGSTPASRCRRESSNGRTPVRFLLENIMTKFQEAIKDIPEQVLCETFSISRPSVRRWKAGVSAPAPAMQELIYRKLKEIIPE